MSFSLHDQGSVVTQAQDDTVRVSHGSSVSGAVSVSLVSSDDAPVGHGWGKDCPWSPCGQRIVEAYLDHALRGERRTHIYFIEDGVSAAVKIGIADDVEKRLAQLQVGNPNQLGLLFDVIAPASLERWLHGEFEHLHVRGEWFEAHTDIHDVAAELDSFARPSFVWQTDWDGWLAAIGKIWARRKYEEIMP